MLRHHPYQIFLITVLGALSLAKAADDKVVLKSKDGQSEITLPAGWAAVTSHSGLSQLMAANAQTHEYIDLVTESREDMDIKLKDYATHRRDAVMANLNSAHSSDLQDIKVNGLAAVRFEITGATKKSGIKLGYVFTVLETKKNFHQVLTWTTASHFEQEKDDLSHLAEGLHEIQSATQPVTK